MEKTRREILQYGTRLGTLAVAPHSVAAEDGEISSRSPPEDGSIMQSPIATQTVSSDDWSGDVLIVRECFPWGASAHETVLNDQGVDFAVGSASDIASVDLSQYEVVILPSTQTGSYYQTLANNAGELQSYVENGGVLVAHVADNGYPCTTTWNTPFVPGDLGHTVNYIQDLSLVDGSHSIYDGISEIDLDGWNYSSHGYLTNVPSDATTLVTDSSGNPVHVEYSVGSGTVIASIQTLEWPFVTANGTEQVLRNELEYAFDSNPDIEITDVRLVQTTENTYTDRDRYDTYDQSTLEANLVEEQFVGDPDSLVADRVSAVVFDLEGNPTADNLPEDVTFTLTVGNDTTAITLDRDDVVIPATAEGNTLLGVAEDEGVASDIATVPLDSDFDSVSVTLANTDYFMRVEEEIDRDIVEMPELNIGFVGVQEDQRNYVRAPIPRRMSVTEA